MLEESIPAAWASLNSWFTPTLLFVFLNLMIGTIAVASSLGNQKPPQDSNDNNNNQQQSPSVLQRLKSINLYRYRSQDLTPFSSITRESETEQARQFPTPTVTPLSDNLQPPPPLARPPSVIQRLKSINLYRYKSQDLNPISAITTTTPEPETQQVQQFHDSPHEDMETIFHNLGERHVERTISDTIPASGAKPLQLSKKMKKSASTKSAFSHFEEEEIQLAKRPATVREGRKELQSFGDDEEVDAKADDFINKFKQDLKLQRLDSILRYKEMLGKGAGK